MNLPDKWKDVVEGLPPMPQHAQSHTYSVQSLEEVLYPIVEKSNAIVVAGAFFGDEGKGKITDAIAYHEDVAFVARTNSGENAGHTVVLDGKKYILNLTPSGILVPGMKNFIGPECVADPVNLLLNELAPLYETNDISDKLDLTIGNVQIVTPWVKLQDLVHNFSSNGSTGRGMTPAHVQKVSKEGIRLDDLNLPDEVLIKKLNDQENAFKQWYGSQGLSKTMVEMTLNKINNRGGGKVPEHVETTFREGPEYILEQFKLAIADARFPIIGDPVHQWNGLLRAGRKGVFEASQSYFLANGVENHVGSTTSANTTAAGVIASARINQQFKYAVINAIKEPSSRVGRGFNPAGFVNQTFYSDLDIYAEGKLPNLRSEYDAISHQYFKSIRPDGQLIQSKFRTATGEYDIGVAMAISSAQVNGEFGATTKKPRVTGLIDLVAHAQVNEEQGPYLVISALDRSDRNEQVGLVTGYVVTDECISKGHQYSRGDIIRPGDALPNESVLGNCRPLIKVMDGWNEQPIGSQHGKPTILHKNLQAVIGEIEYQTGATVLAIGNGPEKDDLIYIKRD